MSQVVYNLTLDEVELLLELGPRVVGDLGKLSPQEMKQCAALLAEWREHPDYPFRNQEGRFRSLEELAEEKRRRLP